MGWLETTRSLVSSGSSDAALQSVLTSVLMSTDAVRPHIRSFSGRRGHFTSGQRNAYETLMPRFGIGFDRRVIDACAVFGRTAPRILEIGFGMGETTAAIAQANPDRDYLGVEVYPAGVGALLRRIEESGLGNVRIIQHDAIEVLEHMLEPQSLDAVHVFFPDPWPKSRHHKRRLIRPEIASLIASRLRAGAYLHCATDWAHYALQMLSVLSAEPLLENTSPRTELNEDIAKAMGFVERPAYRPLTKFEKRGMGLGHGVWDIVFRRRTGP